MNTKQHPATDTLAPVLTHLDHLFKEWAATDHGVTLKGSRAVTLPAGLTGNQYIAATSPTTLTGFAFAETTGTAGAIVRLYNGHTVTGDPVITIRLAAGESARDEFTRGVSFPYGLTINVSSGSVEGSTFHAAGS